MGQMLAALLNLQSVERQLATVKRRLRTRQSAVSIQEGRISRLRGDWEALHDHIMGRRKEADRLDVDVREKEEHISRRRSALNTAKTNKEYAAILTEINTAKADNAKVEENALKVMQEVDSLKAEADKIQAQIDAEQSRLVEIEKQNSTEIERLEGMLVDLAAQRDGAVKAVRPEALTAFERIAGRYEGEAMAVIEIHGRRPPFSYVCGGCFMSLNAEHANALRVRDEIRTCDNCGRILYVEYQTNESTAT
jgi:predicted  nucleic acid-binding Zn-ribbon protein